MSMIPSMYYSGRTVHHEPYYHHQTVRDPFQEFRYGGSSLVSAVATPVFPSESRFELTKLDWKETPEAHVFVTELPGLKRNEVKVEVEGRVLCIRGEKSMEKEVSAYMWQRVERSSGSFVRRFKLPDNAKLDKLTAYLENGVLTITVPKKEAKHCPRRSVEIHGGE
ncbi:18.2 kDa class I heat shock protein [Hibiscus syriacus]|uniref:18.2 kDa class I heat shock protein n=1 Tax=Hibiscus syriacus TaxID=106335 RepID=A0A6A2ZE00_HIBSY|nr:18.1 kDa class I heat shock protein-like [Hibiscus syriacus]KAE8689750.1 18.2 kDa class I heat shock protein [Hibiscus syriacus]